MTIEKNGKIYTVKEFKKSWTLSIKIGSVPVNFKLDKTDCPTFESLKEAVNENDIF
jgi:hypothetical protein